jgi:hypothetical protein
MAVEKACRCGEGSARLHHLNSILPGETVKTIYCPSCSKGVKFDAETMVEDNGWIVEYDMEVASLHAEKMGKKSERITPDFIFDEGFSAWQGFTPNDLEKANEEKIALAKMAKSDGRKYIELIREWSISREQKLQKEGWRKARAQVEV